MTFLGTQGQDWTLVGAQSLEGKQAYVIERTYEDETLQTTETLWIEAAMFLPLKSVVVYGQDETTENETVYADFGAPVDVQVPPEALVPTPTPEPTRALPMTSDSPTAIAESFMAAMEGDFEAVSEYFALDRQPESWRDVFPPPLSSIPGAGDVTGCLGIDYQVVERRGQSGGVERAQVNFVFATDCLRMPLWSEDQFQSNSLARVFLDNATGYWYVSRACYGLSANRGIRR